MFTSIILLFGVFPLISAPIWCYVLAWISFGVSALSVVINTIKNMSSKKND